VLSLSDLIRDFVVADESLSLLHCLEISDRARAPVKTGGRTTFGAQPKITISSCELGGGFAETVMGGIALQLLVMGSGMGCSPFGTVFVCSA